MDNQIIKKDYIFLDIDAKNQKDVFKFIAKKAYDLKIVSKQDALVKGFEKREAEGSTGFEDGFAIPHARINEVKKAAVFLVRFKNEVDWNSMDGKPTKVAIALLVPNNPSGDEHLAILSDVAVKLMDEDFKNGIRRARTEAGALKWLLYNPNEVKSTTTTKKESTKTTKKEVVKTDDKKLNIVAITACVVGIAHTYMAEEKLLKAGKELGYNIRVETHGSKGIGTPFTQEEIDAADLVIFATDTNVDNSRFAGKKFYETPVAKAVKDGPGVIKEAIKNGVVLTKNSGEFDTEKSKAGAKKKEGVIQHILAGISYMIPVIVLGGIALAFSLGLAKAIWGPEAGTKGVQIGIDANGNPIWSDPWGPLAILEIIGGAAFTLMIPILAGFIANSIAGRAAIAPAMVGAFIGNDASKFMPLPGMAAVQTPTGFIGAIIAGLLVGYFVKWVNTWKVPRSLAPAMPIFFIPLVAGIGISVIFIYVIGGPIGFVMDIISNGIKSAYSAGNVGPWLGLGLGIALGAMAGFDMGGPINKIAFITGSVLITQGITEPMGAVAAAIPVAPLGMGLTTVIFKRFFNKEERGLGIAALIMGMIGISEGAIPFAIADPRRAIPSNMVGSMVAGGIAGGLLVTDAAAHGGPIVAILGAVPYGLATLYFFIAVIAGTAVTTTMYGTWMLLEAGKVGSVKETHVKHLNDLRDNKTTALEAINEQIKTLKADKKVDHSTEIEKLKLEKVQVKANYKNQVELAKSILKEEALAEKNSLKENNSIIKTNKQTVKAEQKAKWTEFKEANKKATSDEKYEVKESMRNEFALVEKKYRQPFVKEYQQRVGMEA